VGPFVSDQFTPDTPSWGGPAVPDIDPMLEAIEAELDRVVEAVLGAPRGALGVSATGLVGNPDMNLETLVRIGQRSQALYTIAGARADRAVEIWQGLRTLLSASAKASKGEVFGVVQAGALALDHPDLAEAWAKGDVSVSQVRHISRTVGKLTLDDRAEVVSMLTDVARHCTFKDLLHVSKVLVDRANPGASDRELNIAEDKVHFGLHHDGDGYRAEGWFTNEQGAWLQSVLDAHTSVTSSDEVRTRNQRQAEALITMTRQYCASDVIPTLAMARPRLLALAALSDLVAIASDYAFSDLPITQYGETLDRVTTKRLLSDADIVPVLADDDSPQILADIALDPRTAARVRARESFFAKAARKNRTDHPPGASPVLFRLLTTPVRPLALGRSQRIVPAGLRDAVTLRDQHCVVEGCEVAPQRCEVHHVVPWASGGATDLSNLALLCVRHHRSVESDLWRLRPREQSDGPGHYWVSEHRRSLWSPFRRVG
jgi:hypothetical protein